MIVRTKVRKLITRSLPAIFPFFVIGVVACISEPQAPPSPTLKPATPTASPTTQLKSTIQPTVSLVPTATPVSTQAFQSSRPDQTGACSYTYFFEPAPGPCPIGHPIVSAAAEQPFEGGAMVWIEASDSIMVLYDDQSWQQFEDTWSEDQPESDPSYFPPAKRFQPIRGFGKVWRDWPDVRDRLGWALGSELAFETIVQSQDKGAETTEVRFIKLFNGQVAALISRGSDSGDWVIASSGS